MRSGEEEDVNPTGWRFICQNIKCRKHVTAPLERFPRGPHMEAYAKSKTCSTCGHKGFSVHLDWENEGIGLRREV
tara:strand:- start:10846 stop:11070 length:225 start_codon:yes stop_codon:yes gene_type:complete